MENVILKRLWLDRDKKARQDWEWLMDQANLGKTEKVDYTIPPVEEAKTSLADIFNAMND